METYILNFHRGLDILAKIESRELRGYNGGL